MYSNLTKMGEGGNKYSTNGHRITGTSSFLGGTELKRSAIWRSIKKLSSNFALSTLCNSVQNLLNDLSFGVKEQQLKKYEGLPKSIGSSTIN